jgi:hypothetical protein
MSLPQWLIDFADRFMLYLPKLLGAAALVLAGWLVALTLRFATRRVVAKVLRRARRDTRLHEAVEDAGIRSAVPRLVAGFVFWVILLLFAAAAVESLGITVVTEVLSRVTYYLPDVLGAAALILGGVIVGKLARRAVTAAGNAAGIARADGLGQTVQAMALLVAAVIALDQIGIDAQLLVILVAVVVGTTFAAAGLAFGIGARTVVSNIVAAYYVSQAYQVGQTVRIGDAEGEIVTTTPTAIVLQTAEGRLLVPAARFSEEPSLLRGVGQ